MVPFYLVVLSMIGGAISLTRRIPEYQKQSTPGYVGTKKAPVLTPEYLREKLVFQIIQFISAPFIAAVAYYVVEPANTASTVGLAFASGFASETILLWVRAAMDKVRIKREEDEPKGSLAGTISSLAGSAKKIDEEGATVSIVGHSELVPTYADHGQFAINGIPEGGYAIEVKLKTDKICTESVQIQADRTEIIWIDCA